MTSSAPILLPSDGALLIKARHPLFEARRWCVCVEWAGSYALSEQPCGEEHW